MASDLESLWRTARTLSRKAGGAKALPPLLFFTDPVRTPDLEGVLERLPRGAGVVFRAFGADDAVNQGRELVALARRRGLVFLVGADAALARALDADGVHLPERLMGQAWRIRRRGCIVTAAVHSQRALARAGRLPLDAAVLSPIFASRSASAGAAVGEVKVAAWVREAQLPVYGLGGVKAQTAARLSRSGLAGLAAVEALARMG